MGKSALTAKENRRALIYCGLAVVGAVLYGYDGTHYAGILAMERFIKDFGKPTADGRYTLPTNVESLTTSIIQAGEFLGALAAGPIGDFGGRKLGFYSACLLVTLGVTLQLIITGSVPLLTVGRLILGCGVGVVSNVVPLYLSEVPPTAIRGSVVSSWQLLLAIGQVIGACVDQGTKDLSSTASWRIPIAFNYFFIAVIMFSVVVILPESPRWLIYHNEDGKAAQALQKINHDRIDREEFVAEQLGRLQASRDQERENASQNKPRWRDLVTNAPTRRRLICVAGILISQQIGGVQFIFSYTTVFMSSLGLASPFIITIIVDIIEVLGVVASFFIVNRFGRRPILLWNSAIMTAVLLVCGGLGTIPAAERSPMANQAIAAMIMLYVFFFNFSWGPLAWVCASELASGASRQRIMSIGTACFWICAWAVTFTLPYLYKTPAEGGAGLNAQIGWLYAGGSIIAMVFVYLYIPETKGKSLEQINLLLEASVPTREWGSYEFTDTDDEVEKVAMQRGIKPTPETKHVDAAPTARESDDKKTIEVVESV